MKVLSAYWLGVSAAIVFGSTMAGCGGNASATSGSSAADTQAEATQAEGSEASGDASGDASGAPEGDDTQSFKLSESTPREANQEHPSNIVPTATEAAVKFFVVDKEKGPVEDIVIALTDPDGRNYYTDETDATGYTEILLPIGKKYELVYLSLGRQDIAAKVDVPNEPKLNLRLTLRYKRWVPTVQPTRTALAPTPKNPPPADSPRFILDGIEFDSGKATLREESKQDLEQVVAYLTHKKSARIEISGHTDNVGKPARNLDLSKRRAMAVRAYLVSQGIDEGRVEAVGYGDTMPIADNGTEEGRQKNRRIEATEL